MRSCRKMAFLSSCADCGSMSREHIHTTPNPACRQAGRQSDDVIDWMYSNQLDKRNLTDAKKSYLRGEQYNFRKNTWGGDRGNQYTVVPSAQNEHLAKTATKISKEQHVSHMTVKRAAEYSRKRRGRIRNLQQLQPMRF